MKAKRTMALVVALVMVLALSGVALAAAASPSGSTVAQTSSNVVSVQTAPISEAAQAPLVQAAAAFVAQNLGPGLAVQPLLAVNLTVQKTDSGAASVTMNVAGVQEGDTVVVTILNPDGTTKVVYAKVLADGVIELELEDFEDGDIVIGKVVPEDEATANVASSAVTMPMTGGGASAASMALLLAGCLAAVAVCGKALVKAR